MFFGPGDPDCIDCTTINGEYVCTMNCGPAIRMPEGVAEKGDPMTCQRGKHIAGQDARGRAGTAGATVRPRTIPRAENCGSRQLQEIDRQIIRERHADLQTAKRAYAEYREKFDDARGGDARDWLRVGSECSDK